MRRAAAITAWGLGAACVVACIITWNRNAWAGGQPHYVAVHQGSVIVMSSVWERPPRGATGWTYDVFMTGHSRWLPRVVRVGNRYSVGGVRWGAPMHGVSAPLWLVGAVLVGGGLAVRPRRRAGVCRCGYSLEGISGVCPECGASVAGGEA